MPRSKVTVTTAPLPDVKQLDARDEMNFAEFPIALLSDRSPANLSALEFQDRIRDPQTGGEVVRRLTIDAPERFGLPTALDDEVILGLIQLTKVRNNFTERSVNFSRYELIHLLGWPDKGGSYRRLEESFDRWIRVTLDYSRGWWDNEQKSWVDEKFHILERVSLYESERNTGRPTLPFSTFTWNEVVFRSFQAGYLKRLDLDFYLGLRHATARRIYRFMDKKFYHRPRWEFDLAEFAFEHIGLSRSSCQTKPKDGKSYPNLSKVKEKLGPGLEELESRGFLEPLPSDARYTQVRRGSWRIVLVKQSQVPKVIAPAPVDAPPTKALSDDKVRLAAELERRGVTRGTAEALAAKHSAERIERQLDVVDWLLRQVGTELKNPGGWLRAAVEEDFTPPATYRPKADRELQAKAAAERQQKQAEIRKRERDEEEALKAQRAHVRQFLAELDGDPDQKKAFESQATANADPKTREIIRAGGTFASVALQGALMSEVLRVKPVGPKANE